MDRLVWRTCLILLGWSVYYTGVSAQELPEDELQVNISGYFDNYQVKVIYPNIALTKQIGESTSLHTRYLVDAISSASMKSRFTVDGVTSATTRTTGGADSTPDELRHEVGLGFTKILAGRAITFNSIFSSEHDYTSATLAGTFSQNFAKKNTVVTLGLVRSWDKVFPQTRFWKRDRNIITASADVTQIFSTRLIGQLLLSYNETSGHLADNYQVVTIIQQDSAYTFEPIHPPDRIRKATSARLKYRLDSHSSLQFGYRFYWDSWDVTSHTVSTLYQRHLTTLITFGIGVRNYFQSRAFFFKSHYSRPETFMTVDSKLNSGYSNEMELKFTMDGNNLESPMFLISPNIQYNLDLFFYHRHTDSRDWFSRRTDLYAFFFSLGIRYLL